MKRSKSLFAAPSKIMFDSIEERESSSDKEEEIEQELANAIFEYNQKASLVGLEAVYQKPNPEAKVKETDKNRPMEISSKKPVRSRFSEGIQDLKQEEMEQVNEDVTFEDIKKARSDGSKAFFQKPNKEKKAKPSDRDRPMEISCKKPVGKFRGIIQAPKRVARDPRFESLCGELDKEGFRKRYDFLFEKELPGEKEEIKKQLKKTKDPNVINDLKNRISWIDNQLRSVSAKCADNAILATHKKREREAAKQGKRPFYLKKSEVRKQRLTEKYTSLKDSGKLESFMEKKRKKNASKDHRYVPYRRPQWSGNEHENPS